MSEPGAVPATTDLVSVEADLAEHIIDLLATADVPALERRGEGNLTTVVVRSRDIERARATLDLVLPGLLAEESGQLLDEQQEPRLSGRLIRRSDWPQEPTTPATPGRGPGLVDGRAAFAASLGAADDEPEIHYAEDDGDFEPPPPPPLPRGDVISRFAWLGAIGGPLMMVAALLFGLPGLVAVGGLAASVAGFAVLVLRMPDRARTDDGWDDGAVL